MSRVVAMDCEMVESENGNMLARVSIVDQNNRVILDEYVKPISTVTDYRTSSSGIEKRHLDNGTSFNNVKIKVSKLINGAILVGHSLQFDLEALNLSHPASARRDLAKIQPFTNNNGGQAVALKTLARDHLGRNIQNGAHDSVEDAKACMDLYRRFPNSF